MHACRGRGGGGSGGGGVTEQEELVIKVVSSSKRLARPKAVNAAQNEVVTA